MGFQIGEFNFEDCAPQHLCNARRHDSRSERKFVLLNLIAPLRTVKAGGDALVVFGVKERIVPESRSYQRNQHRSWCDSAGVHVAMLTANALTMHAQILQVTCTRSFQRMQT